MLDFVASIQSAIVHFPTVWTGKMYLQKKFKKFSQVRNISSYNNTSLEECFLDFTKLKMLFFCTKLQTAWRVEASGARGWSSWRRGAHEAEKVRAFNQKNWNDPNGIWKLNLLTNDSLQPHAILNSWLSINNVRLLFGNAFLSESIDLIRLRRGEDDDANCQCADIKY